MSQSRRIQADSVVLYGYEVLSRILLKDNRLVVSENRMLRRILRLKRESGDNYSYIKKFRNFDFHQISLVRLNQGK